jgi:hypothetical protein
MARPEKDGEEMLLPHNEPPAFFNTAFAQSTLLV